MGDLTLEFLPSQDHIHWNQIVSGLTNAHILQTTHWGEVKSQVGWEEHYLLWKDKDGNVKAAAMMLSKSLPLIKKITKSCIIYIPRGPVLNWAKQKLVDQVLSDLIHYGKKIKAVFIKMDPDLTIGLGFPGSINYEPDTTGQSVIQKLIIDGWRFSNDQIQFRNTVLLDLSLSEEELLSAMKQKTRYNISLAERKGVIVRTGNQDDFPNLYKMYAQTAFRDGFTIRDEDYYLQVWNSLFLAGMAIPLIAEVEGSPVAAMILFHFANRAYYFYGMSSGEHREKMPNHLLQWEAVKISKRIGCIVYDFWGAPDKYNENDPLWGVFRFKDGFNGRVAAGIGAWDYVLNPLAFKLYNNIIPAMLNIMRKFGRKRISREVNE